MRVLWSWSLWGCLPGRHLSNSSDSETSHTKGLGVYIWIIGSSYNSPVAGQIHTPGGVGTCFHTKLPNQWDSMGKCRTGIGFCRTGVGICGTSVGFTMVKSAWDWLAVDDAGHAPLLCEGHWGRSVLTGRDVIYANLHVSSQRSTQRMQHHSR